MNNEVYKFRKFLETHSSDLSSTKPLYFTNFKKLKLIKRGKVRDIYEVGDYFLIVSTDRISAFDVILPTPIPFKGMILNMISYFWFDRLKDIENHIVSIIPEEYPEECGDYSELIRYRSMLVRKMNVYKVECIVRGYLAGSGYDEYIRTSSICGIRLPEGLKMSSKLPYPIFTPSTKSETGHDKNITLDEARAIVGDVIEEIQSKSLEIFKKASEILDSKGILLCDTKFEFGFDNKSGIALIDEVLTPDSSRFWFKDNYKEGVPQESYDKQFVRDYLKSLVWDKTYPGPDLPQEIVIETAKRYVSIFFRITEDVY